MPLEEVKEEVKPELDDVKQEPAALKAEVSFVQNEKVNALIDGEWYPGTISKVTQESGRVEYSVKWDESDPAAGEEEETDGFSAEELKPRVSEDADDFPVPSMKRPADIDGEPPLKRQALGESN